MDRREHSTKKKARVPKSSVTFFSEWGQKAQTVLIIGMSLLTLVGAYLFIRDAAQLNEIITGPVGSDRSGIIRETANMQREVLRTQVAIGLLLQNPAGDSETIIQRYAFFKTHFRNMLARRTSAESAIVFAPGSLAIIDQLESDVARADDLIEQLRTVEAVEQQRNLLLDLNLIIEEIEPKLNDLFLSQEVYEVELFITVFAIINNSRRLLIVGGIVLIAITAGIVYLSRQMVTIERRANERFQLAAAAVNSAIYDWDIATNTLIWTEGISEVFGYRPAEIEPTLEWWLDHIHPEDREIFHIQLLADIEAGQDNDAEYRFCKADGEYLDVSSRGRIVLNNEGRAIRMVGSLEDITDRRLALAAQEASRLKTQLLGNLSHELRTPLGGIIGYAEMLEEDLDSEVQGEQHELVKRIITSARSLLTMINTLLQQSQIEQGKIDLHLKDFEFEELVEIMYASVGSLAKKKGLDLTYSIADDLPSAVQGDIRWLRQILINLVGNAIKFTREGSVQLRLYQPDATHWAMQVSDTGQGISKEAQIYIFDAFRQADSSNTRRHSGSGLGLSIVKELIELMGGEISVQSQLGHGSTFTVVFPLILRQDPLLEASL